MSDPELPEDIENDVFRFHAENGEVFMTRRWRLDQAREFIHLGPKEQVMEAFSQFLAHEDYGERMDG